VPPPESGGEPRGTNADLNALPPELAKQSVSAAAVVLPLDAALGAIAHLSKKGRRLESWEGWVQLRDGTRMKSITHPGSFALPRDTARAAQTASEAIRRAQAMWDRNPDYANAALYFGLTFVEP
jgi:hypothetical protein